MRAAAIFLCLMALAGCADSASGPHAPLAQSQPMTAPALKNDAAAPMIEVATSEGVYPRADGTELVRLVGETDRVTDKQRVYVDWGETYTGKDWRSYYKAAGDTAQPYDFVQLDRSGPRCDAGQACSYTEKYRISIPAREILVAAREGLTFKVYSRSGKDRTVTVSPAIAAAFADKMAEAARLAGRGHGGT
jgi:hypothetical protein